jgi:hypothetical protein
MNLRPTPNPAREAVEAVARRSRRVKSRWLLAGAWCGAILIGLGAGLAQRKSGWASVLTAPAVLVAGIAITSVFKRQWKRKEASSPEAALRAAALRIESQYPELDSRLITAVQQQPESLDFNFLQRRLLAEVSRHSHSHDWSGLIPAWSLGLARTAHLAAIVCFLLVCWNLRHIGGSKLLASIAEREVVITPGDIDLERGESLVVLAHFGSDLPSAVTLVVENGPQNARRIPLVKSLADPMFGGSLPEVSSNFVYHVEYGAAGRETAHRSRDFNVKVFEYPRLERADADITFPVYTGLTPKQIENTHRVSAVEGSRLHLKLLLNKPVVSARLVPKSDSSQPINLPANTNSPLLELTDFALEKSDTFSLKLIDSEGRSNKVAAEFVFEALTNRTPEFHIASPRGDTRPSALEEVAFEGTVWDDFGLHLYGIGYTTPGSETKFIELGKTVPAKEKRPFKHVLKLEDLNLEPDQLVAWFIWADDVGPDGEVRRSTSDLFFSEIRPFEEVFREAIGMGGGGGQQGGDQNGQGNGTTKLTELQKQIINATWNIRRRTPARDKPKLEKSTKPDSRATESSSRLDTPPGPQRRPAEQIALIPRLTPSSVSLMGERVRVRASVSQFFAQPSPSPRRSRTPRDSSSSPDTVIPTNSASSGNYADDLAVVRDAQAQAIQQVESQASRLSDPRSVELWAAARQQMEEALKRLDSASNSPSLLPDALAAQESAYQAMLKLQQHEYQVARSRNRNAGGGGGRGDQMQRQLEQMDLTQDQDRYETQRQAQRPQNNARTEQLRVMNRLQELARRQQDLNERLKELQSALQEAKTEAEREEIRRRLKRLQEEEQQMLSDVDELRQRMDRPDSQSQLADQNRQLEETRQDIQRAAEAAGQGSVSQALAAGARAQQQLQTARDQLRKDSSSQFADDLRQLRSEARELAQRQQQINQDLSQENSGERKSLSNTSGRDRALEELTRQKGRITNLVERATAISQESEQSEPLVSRQLYDTIRKLSQDAAKGVRETQDDVANRGLMTRNLYERFKDATEPDAAKLMELSSEMLRQDFLKQAQETAQRAGSAIEDFKRGLERAAENVVGSDTEGLRQAQQELDRLTEQLQREMQREMAAAGGQAGGTNAGRNSVGTTNRFRGPGAGTNRNALAEGRGANGTNSTNRAIGGGGTNGPSLARLSSNGGTNSEPSADSQRGEGNGNGQQEASQSDNARQASNDQREGNGQQGGNGQRDGNGQRSSEQASNTPQDGQQTGDQTGDGSRSANDRDGNRNGGRNGSVLDQAIDNGRRAGAAGDGGGGAWDFNRIINPEDPLQQGPLTGRGYTPWTDRLRDVEELIEIPELRNDVAAARERARLLRQQYKSDLKKPDWAVVQLQVMQPLLQVRDRIADELARREAADALVPIDRDPVPPRYSDLVRKYYEGLGKGTSSATTTDH